jgi:hypothetical protein
VDPGELAADYLLAARRGQADALALERRLAELRQTELGGGLNDDASRLAFWIDVYNGAVVRQQVPELRSWWARLQHFRQPAVVVAGRSLSLDAIEHGILRRSRWKLGLGFVANPAPGAFEREHRLEALDPRIHFALNCGAASCPPIAAYRAGEIEAQLERTTRAYLQAETDREDEGIAIPMLLLWYIGDFGGPPGIRRLLRHHQIDGWNGPIRFKPYDWTPAPDQWASEGS